TTAGDDRLLRGTKAPATRAQALLSHNEARAGFALPTAAGNDRLLNRARGQSNSLLQTHHRELHIQLHLGEQDCEADDRLTRVEESHFAHFASVAALTYRPPDE